MLQRLHIEDTLQSVDFRSNLSEVSIHTSILLSTSNMSVKNGTKNIDRNSVNA